VRPSGSIPSAELTWKAVLLGLLLAFVFGAANAYLGMRAGQTVAATIPAAVIAMAVFRLPRFRGTLLEQNITRTAASVGEALVAGAIFTIPAFVLIETGQGSLWRDLRSHYWEASFILLAGGLLGVFFIVILRRPLCVDMNLPWPESVASVQIVRAGQDSGDAPRLVFGSMAVGALVQFLKSDKGFQVFRELTEGFILFPRSLITHFDLSRKPIGSVAHAGGLPWATPNLSPALIGIGYIIGPRYASINAAGGILAWWILIPLLLFFDPDLANRLGSNDHALAANTLWLNVVRPVAVGAMLVAAAHTLFSMRESLTASLRGAWRASLAAQRGTGADTSEADIPIPWLVGGCLVLILGMTALYHLFTGSFLIAVLCAVLMTIAGFLLCAVGGYLVGLVGSSNQPLSGLTLTALLLTALLMVGVGAGGVAGLTAVLGVASVVCCAASVSGSLVQDLKAGHLLGGTPWKMQLVEIIAVVMLAFFLTGPIIVLHEANLATGGIGGRALPAPQAGLMAQLTQGIVGGQMAWGLLAVGVALGGVLLLVGARAPMLIAVGMYLPFDTSLAILAGGVLKWLCDRLAAQPVEAEERGTLIASGLIAGEAIMGIVLAVTFLAGVPSFTELLTGASPLAFCEQYGGLAALAGFAVLAWLLVRVPSRYRSAATRTTES